MSPSALSPMGTLSEHPQGNKRSACWAGIARIFTATVSGGRRIPSRGCERRAPSLHGTAHSSGSTAGSRGPACAGPPPAPEKPTDVESAAILAPKSPQTVNKTSNVFGRIAQLFIASATMGIWRSPAAEALGYAIIQTPSGPKEAHIAPAKQPSAQALAQFAYGAAQVAAFAVVIWQAIAVKRHADVFPSAIWLGGHDPNMNISCLSLFEVARWSVVLAVAGWAAQFAALIGLVLTGIWSGADAFGLLAVMRAVVGAWSWAVLLNTRAFERQSCAPLADCMAWTCVLYFGMAIYDVLAPVLWTRPRHDPEKARLL